ncbi:pyridoxal phosphate-dependent aminotransferase [Streptomyces yaizuensis]|uniref:Aminotransferase n=1 Tax=Streptomyces yaizuensis TaxID=2989713 RepID=A0ABQ5P7E1_9ACTN|nr:pyridoxal phosphate-dependent aminotransferase [Streptomyces sp. YSPA8]GLF98500.1 pyridoxal phosphate-dependent aminotransferase [Streptomyces sp. YSPA8]
MKSRTASRFSHLERSATIALLDEVQRLRAQGLKVLDLNGGEPDFATAEHIAAEAGTALHEGFTHYTPSRGLLSLREAISEKLRQDNGLHTHPATDIIVTPSAKHALYISLLAVLDPGDEVIVPTPGWVSYTSMAHLAGARPVPAVLSAANGFRITRELLESRVSERSKAIVVNTPNNPTGRVLSREEATAVAEFAIAHDLFIIADEIYEKIRYDGREHISPGALPGCAERTLTVNGFSKGYAMTGWRLGYVAGPAEVIGQLLKVQEHTVGCAGSFVQRGGVAALTGPQDFVQDMVDEYAARRELIVGGLNSLPGVVCAAPEGAFYAFADIRGTGIGSSAEFAAWALREAGVALTPGSAFGRGGEGHVRLSFATSRTVIDEAVGRLSSALAVREGATGTVREGDIDSTTGST